MPKEEKLTIPVTTIEGVMLIGEYHGVATAIINGNYMSELLQKFDGHKLVIQIIDLGKRIDYGNKRKV